MITMCNEEHQKIILQPSHKQPSLVFLLPVHESLWDNHCIVNPSLLDVLPWFGS